MAINNVSELSTTAASNTDLAGVSILGTGLVSTADDSFRNTGAFLAKWWSDLGSVNTVGGTGDAITITTPTVYTALKTGMSFRFIAGAANTGAATLNFDAIGAKAVRKISGGTDVALVAGNLVAGETYTLIYRASANSAAGAWVLVGLPVLTGVFTPAITFGGGSTGVTYTSRFGTYRRIGDIVDVWGTIVLSAKGSSTGAMAIGGLPFTINANINAVATFTGWANLTTVTFLYGTGGAGSTSITVLATGTTSASVVETNINNTTALNFQMRYYV